MAGNDEDVTLWAKSFDIETSHCARLDLFILEHSDLLLKRVEEAHRSVRATNRDEVLHSCDAVGHALSDLFFAMESI